MFSQILKKLIEFSEEIIDERQNCKNLINLVCFKNPENSNNLRFFDAERMHNVTVIHLNANNFFLNLKTLNLKK